MEEDEFRTILKEKYSDYPSILPVCTLTEEETTFLIRERKPGYTLSSRDPIKTLPIREDPQIGSNQKNTHGSCYHWLIGEDPIPSSLMEVAMSHRFRERIKNMKLVTLGDREGLCFSILSHSGAFTGGYPHWSDNTDWEKDPYMISCDRCTLSWDRYAYFCNGPKTIIDVPDNCLVVYTTHHTNITINGSPALFLKLFPSSKRPQGDLFFCRSHSTPDSCWVLFEKGGGTFKISNELSIGLFVINLKKLTIRHPPPKVFSLPKAIFHSRLWLKSPFKYVDRRKNYFNVCFEELKLFYTERSVVEIWLHMLRIDPMRLYFESENPHEYYKKRLLQIKRER